MNRSTIAYMDIANAAVTLTVVLGSMTLFIIYVLKFIQKPVPDDAEKARMDREYLGQQDEGESA